MKKFLVLFLMTCAFLTTYAQKQWYQTTGFKKTAVYNGQYQWPQRWEQSNMRICIDTDNDLITIYSPQTQVYRLYDVYNNGQPYYDSSGGKQIKFYAIDQDYDKCTVRLRVETNGNSQIYIDFSNAAWVYNVTRIQ